MENREEIFRSFAFINYNIPPQADHKGFACNYITLGFFDAMKTKLVTADEAAEHEKENTAKPQKAGCALMGAMWRYNQELALQLDGTYSFQNVFGVRMGTREEERTFWENNTELPLAFVTFLQMKPQKGSKKATLSEQKERLEGSIRDFVKERPEEARDRGEKIEYLCYTTLDKNDFIVGFRTNSHKGVSKLLVQLHEKYTGKDDIGPLYTYSVICVEKELLKNINEPGKDGWLKALEKETIDSISFKGVINTEDGRIPIEQKAKAFTAALDKALFEGTGVENNVAQKEERRLYDIIGECDYRYIAREVPLVNLLKAMAPPSQNEKDDTRHPLNYSCKLLRATMFSTRLVLNQREKNWDNNTDETDLQKEVLKGLCDLNGRTQQCDALEGKMAWVREAAPVEQAVSQYQDEYEDVNYLTNYVAMWKLLTSLKALERAPARKYEFRSLYEPYQLLHEVLFDQENNQGNFKQLKQNWAQIKDLSGMIQNFSTTLHSTLRNDLQFFQVNDFNAIAHYAPAKLRAFYAAWVSELVDYYQTFQKERNLKKYAFLVVPDNGSQANTKELKRKNMAPIRFVRGGQLCAYRIMCINLPERLLYTPEIACVILAHEVAHFGGGQAKRRAGTKGDAWGEDRLSAYIRSLSIWCALMINSTMLSFLDEKVYTETTQGFSAVAKQAFQLYLKRTMAETSFLSTHIEDLLAGYWGRTAEKFDEQTNTGVECIGIARIVLQQFVDKSKSEMNLSDYDYLMLDMETDFSKYLDENWKNPEWRRRCSEKIEGSGLLEELWNEELKSLVVQIVHAVIQQLSQCIQRMIELSTDRKDMPIQELLMMLLRESHADLVSILELKLTPEQYVYVQRKSALVGRKKAMDQYTRMYVTAEAMVELGKRRSGSAWLDGWRNWKQWWQQTMQQTSETKDGQEEKQFLRGWAETMRCVVYDSYLEQSRSKERKSFGMLENEDEIYILMNWARAAFYCSKNIQETAVSYLAACGETMLSKPRENLSELYQAFSCEGLEKIAERIDSFLQAYEEPNVQKPV